MAEKEFHFWRKKGKESKAEESENQNQRAQLSRLLLSWARVS